MKLDQGNPNDSFIDEIRGSGTQETLLNKRLGFYAAKDVDRYITNLQDQIQGTETVYQERFEEMRTSLLGMTRERDEKIRQIQDLEKKLAESQDWQAQMLTKGLVAVPSVEYQLLKKKNEIHDAELEQFRIEQRRLNDEIAHLKDELNKGDQMSTDLRNQRQVNNTLQTDLEALRRQIADLSDNEIMTRSSLEMKDSEIRRLVAENQTERQVCDELKYELELARRQVTEHSDNVRLGQAKYQALDIQYQSLQEAVSKVTSEKEALESELRNQQQSGDLQREAMQSRFKSVLTGQNQFLSKLKENFSATVACMESLTETGLRGFVDENTDPGTESEKPETETENPVADTDESISSDEQSY